MNESSIRAIQKSEVTIRASVASGTDKSAKVCMPCDTNMKKHSRGT